MDLQECVSYLMLNSSGKDALKAICGKGVSVIFKSTRCVCIFIVSACCFGFCRHQSLGLKRE